MVVSEDPYSTGKWFEAKNINRIPLARLGEFLGVSTYDTLMKGFEPPHLSPDYLRSLESIPEVLQDKIRTLTD